MHEKAAESLAADLAAILIARNQTIAVAECSTGGLISNLLTDLPGSSAWFLGAAVTYSDLAKLKLAGVRADVLAEYGAVSSEAALALAQGIRQQLGADWGIAESGIAGPQVERRSAKPGGLTYLAVAGIAGGRPIEATSSHCSRAVDRPSNKQAFAAALLRLAIATIAAR